MPCKKCGEICSCSIDPLLIDPQPALSRVDSDSSKQRGSVETNRGLNLTKETPLEQTTDPEDPSGDGSSVCEKSNPGPPDNPNAWRDEVAARLTRYQARHKPRPPRYPSLQLPFENPPSAPVGAKPPGEFFPPSHCSPASESLVAPDQHREPFLEPPAQPVDPIPPLRRAVGETTPALRRIAAQAATATAKIIEFPRPWAPPAPPPGQLADPVMTHPRILDVPDVIPPPPALGGITIEAPALPEIERRPGIDFPLEGPSLPRRLSAAAIDGVITLTACILFALVFWKLTTLRPPRLQIAEMTAGFTVLFWACYQYLLIVYAGNTPGLRLTRLTLSRFDGKPASRRRRRWRVLASFLSAVSIGMGYIWMFLDEDSLCWHDRITHTYLAPDASKKSL